jgi:hypothetical protein
MYRETYWYGCDIPVLLFPIFARKSKKGDIFTAEELAKLFKPDLYQDKESHLFYSKVRFNTQPNLRFELPAV